MMRLFVVLLLLFYCKGEKEDIPDMETLLNDPEALFKLEKRLGNLLADLESEGQVDSPPAVGCSALSGVLDNDCEFTAKNGTIIKTRESLNKHAKFLEDRSNISCARDCTELCCGHAECDTAIYQNKAEHNCYLFHCGTPNSCTFDDHADYWVSTLTGSHNQGPVITHENELQNLGSDTLPKQPEVTVPPTTVRPTTTTKLGLGEDCSPYSAHCNDSHADCLKGLCQCRSGYYEKQRVCRKRCRDEEFECMSGTQCVHKTYVCDGSQDCADGSDEFSCTDKDKAEQKQADTRPQNKITKVTIGDTDSQTSRPIVTEAPPKPAAVTQAPVVTEKKVLATSPKPLPVQPVETVQTQDTDSSSEEDSKSSDNSKETDTEDSKPTESESTDKDSKGSNSTKTETGSGGSGQFKFLNVEAVEVDSFTDGSQGPIVALSLGLAITVVLLIFVGCRLRTVKRRLRKGRALHSNEADYLINGMYL